jgi:hypothetical protein
VGIQRNVDADGRRRERPAPRGAACSEEAVSLDAVVYGAEGVFVGVASGDGSVLGVLLGEMGVVPLFHGGHGVVGSGEGLFGADCSDPSVDGLFVSVAEIVEFR